MRRALAPAFVTTFLACNKTPVAETPPDATITRNPPPILFEEDASARTDTPVDSGASEADTTGADAAAKPDATASKGTHRKRKRTAPPIPWTASSTSPSQLRFPPLNPSDREGRIIYALPDDRCAVQVPYEGPPVQLPPGVTPRAFEEVDCPPAMDDPAWDNCTDRLAFDEGSSKCFCVSSFGNPPPPPRMVPCPADAKARVKKAPPE